MNELLLGGAIGVVAVGVVIGLGVLILRNRIAPVGNENARASKPADNE